MEQQKQKGEPRDAGKNPGILKEKEIQNAGVLKEGDNKMLEFRLRETLKNLSHQLTKKDILSLMSVINVTHSLESLKAELQKEKKLKNLDISEETIQEIVRLIKEAHDVAESGLKELKVSINELNVSKDFKVDPSVYLSHRFAWIKKIEESPLGKNMVIDLSGVVIGSVDSAVAVLKLLFDFLQDLVLLPKHTYDQIKKRRG